MAYEYQAGAEFQVASQLANNQDNPSVAVLGNGDYVVTWWDMSGTLGDTAEGSIKAQRFNAAGDRIGAEFLVNTKTAETQIYPVVTALRGGGFVITWQDANLAASASYDVRAQIFNGAGARVGSEFLVDGTGTFLLQARPDVAALQDGGFVITWETNQSSSVEAKDIEAQVFTASGARGGEFWVNTVIRGTQDGAAVTGLAGGGFVVTWQHLTDVSATGYDIAAQVFTAGGGKVGPEFRVNTNTFAGQTKPVAAALAGGGFVVTWQDVGGTLGEAVNSSAIKAQMFDASGVMVGSEFLVNTQVANHQYTPRAVGLPDGGFVITWVDYSGTLGDSSGASIKAQVFTASGAKSGGEFLVNTATSGAQLDPDVASFADGSFVVTWSDGAAGSSVDNGIKSKTFFAGNGAPHFVEAGEGGGIIQVSNGNADSTWPAFSADGTKVVFQSLASNLVTGDSNGVGDIFVKDLVTGELTRVSTSASGGQGNALSQQATFTPDPGKVVFWSTSTSLVPGDTLSRDEAFVKTLATGAITQIITTSTGGQADGSHQGLKFSPDGSKIVFYSEASGLLPGRNNYGSDAYLKDLSTGVVTRLSANGSGIGGNDSSYYPVFSPDGSKVAFFSRASNLVDGDTNGAEDVFIRDLATGIVTRLSTDSSGTQGNGNSTHVIFSPDGTKVAFTSSATNLVDGDTNGFDETFIKDLSTGAVTRVITDSDGNQVAGYTNPRGFSADGTKFLFTSTASDLVADDTNGVEDVFIKDLLTGAVTRVSVNAAGTQADAMSILPILSPDGNTVVFFSKATTLTPGVSDGSTGLFIKDLTTGAVTRILQGSNYTGTYSAVSFSADGSKLVFASEARLLADDTNSVADIYVKDLTATPVRTGSITEDGRISAAGVLAFADRDKADVHTVSVIGPDGALGTLTATVTREAATTFTGGRIDWNYTADPALIQSLKHNETRTETFTLRLSDGKATADQTVVITLNGANDAPVLTGTQAALTNGTAGAAYGLSLAQLLQGYSDVDGDTLSVAGLVADHGAISDNGDGTFTLAPQAGYAGQVRLTYTVGDGHGGTVAAEQTLELIAGNQSLTGTNGPDNLNGGAGNDTLRGLGGDDVLDGRGGNDSMYGGLGDDFYTVAETGDKVIELAAQGIDTVYALINYKASDNVENVYLGAGYISAYGNTLNNLLIGSFGNNTLSGADGDDTLRGLEGNDKLDGGAGHDRLEGGDGNDALTGGDGSDALDGGAGNDNLNGGARWDTLTGGDGNDILDGGADNDAMYGGTGDDTYVVDHAGDRVYEYFGEGTDTVKASISYALTADVENLSLIEGAVSGTGNGLSNAINGSSLNNILSGGLGNDSLYGWDGDDSLVGGNDHDRMSGGNGNDTLVGGHGNDQLGGGAGADDFVFSSLSVNGHDHIVDFVHGVDRLVFVGANYGFAAGGTLSDAQFTTGAVAVGASAQFVWDSVGRHLWFDSDGAGGLEAIELAMISGGATVTKDDLHFV